MKFQASPILAALAILPAARAYWRMSCSLIQTGRIDPIVSPGQVSSHVHKIAGASAIYLNSTFASLSASSCSSCEIQDDKSAYWTPELYYQHGNGSFEPVPNSGMAVYYLGRGENRSFVEPFPSGFQMLSGNFSARAYDNTTYTFGGTSGVTYVGGQCGNNDTCTGGTWSTDPNAQGPRFFGRPVSDRISFACLSSPGGPETPGMSQTDCANGLRAQVHFQSCWDGMNLYKSDNSHVDYMSQIDNGVCPPTHPVQLPHVFFEVLYSVNNVDKSDGGMFLFSYGDPTGFGFHGDFLNGWNASVLANAVQNCLNPDNGGAISACPALAASDISQYSWNCPEMPSIVQEPVTGMLAQLPGCISITTGPAPAPISSMSCPAGVPPPAVAPLATQPPPPDTPAVNATQGNWTYLGCAQDLSGGRVLNGPSFTSNNMTTELCQQFCARNRMMLSGTEFGTQCFCSASPVNVQTTAACSQPMVCAGNHTEYCGGPAQLNLWNSTSSQPTQTVQQAGGSSFAGCYSEGTNGRALIGATFSATNMTVERCVAYCSGGGFALAGVEYAQECYCGNTPSNGAQLLSGTVAAGCNMPCAGNNGEYCGGPSRLDVYGRGGSARP